MVKLARLMGHTSVTTTQEYLKAFSNREERQSSNSVFDRLYRL